MTPVTRARLLLPTGILPNTTEPEVEPMAELKTTTNRASVRKFIDGIEDETRRADCRTVMKLMQDITKAEPAMWGPSIVGFGSYHYKYESGREGDWFVTGFSPRKQALTLYITSGFSKYDELLATLGTHKTGKSCLYIKRLDDIHLPTLKKLIKASVAHVSKKSTS
jgi:hypothetical protein